MPAPNDILRTLEEDTSSALHLARDQKTGAEMSLRRFKTNKQEEIDGLRELFTQLAAIDCPNLGRPLEFGADKDGFFTLGAGPPAGETLEQVLERGPLTAEEFETVAAQLLEALTALHEQAVVHGSIRPDHVRISGKNHTEWRVTLHGFGQGFAARDDSKEALIRAYRCTAPEQWEDGTTRRRTDVYALGCVLYEALTARAPFDGRALKELRLKHLHHDLPPLKKLAPHVPDWMCAWVMHLLAADPEQRPRKASAARELFERREAPNLPELPPRTEAPAATTDAVVTPPVTLSQGVSAPVMLPATPAVMRHATSSTIPISAGPHVAGPAPARQKRAAPPAPLQRRSYTPPRKPPSAVQGNKTPILVACGAIVLMLGIFILPHCGQKPPPAKPAAKAPAKSTKSK